MCFGRRWDLCLHLSNLVSSSSMAFAMDLCAVMERLWMGCADAVMVASFGLWMDGLRRCWEDAAMMA
ncbi:unnamed protein product [Cuscuta epithymum]|uniref:Uncharacterized protein n=1 Tax=Cuscuta epithymum TaxID=186058 RepID=A0AAV0G0G7_9ASTE|nr:unnamed protein product [Cuscuta epithymum]